MKYFVPSRLATQEPKVIYTICDGADFTIKDIPKRGKTGLILLSQSGETKDLHHQERKRKGPANRSCLKKVTTKMKY